MADKTMSRRAFLRLSGAALAGMTLAACGGAAATPTTAPKAPAAQPTTAPAAAQPTTAPAAATPKPAGKVSLRFLTGQGGDAKIGFDNLLLDFNKEFPDITITQEALSGTGAGPYIDKLQTSIAAGTAPDFFFNWGGELSGVVIDGNKALKLDPAYEKYGWQKRFWPWTVDLAKRNGSIWGVPWQGTGMGFGYRKDLYSSVGVNTPPKTYKDQEALNEALKAKGIFAMSLGGMYGWHPMRLLDYLMEKTVGPDLHNQLAARTISWDNPGVVDSFALFKKWHTNNWIVPDYLGVVPNDARIPMYQGKAAAYFDGSGAELTWKQDGQDLTKYDYYVPPTDQTPWRYCGYLHQHQVYSGTKSPDQTLTFLNWFMDPKQQKTYIDKGVFNRSASAGVQIDAAKWPMTARIYNDMAGLELKNVYLPKDQSFDPELINTFFQAQTDVTTGKIQPSEAGKVIQKGIEEWRAKNNKKV
jgi:raffinose/stachyose/melibiose transport system substrate-binding protein